MANDYDVYFEQALAAGNGAPTIVGNAKDDLQVYFKPSTQSKPKSGANTISDFKDLGGNSGIMSYGEAVAQYYLWNDSEKKEWKDLLVSLGFDEDFLTYQKCRDLWKEATTEAGQAYTFGNREITPFEQAKILWQGNDNVTGKKSNNEKFTGTKSHSFSNDETMYNQSEPARLGDLVTDVFQKLLGRAATPGEKIQIAAHVNAVEAANPRHSTNSGTASTSYVGGDVTDTKNVSVTSQYGGLPANQSQSQIVMDDAMGMPEYGAFQAATTYMDYLRNALRPVADVHEVRVGDGY